MPSCPPPSLDMPPSGGQYLLAGRGIAGASPYLTGIANRTLATPKRFDLNTGWHSPGASGPPSTSGLSRDDASGSTSTPPDSLFGTSPRDAPTFVSTSLKGPSKLSGILSPRRRSGAANGNSGSRLQQTSVPTRGLRSGTASQDQSSSELQTAPTSLDSHSPPEEPRRGFKTVLAGPTNSVAPPRAVRVMAAPPPGGLFNTDAETILGVASAKISTKAVPPSYAGGDLWPGIDSAPAQVMPHLEAHVLTLAVAHSERGQGLGARLLDALLKEAKAKAVALAAKPRRRGSNQNRSAPTTEQLMAEPMHTTLEVHPANSGALALFQSRQFHRVEGARGTLPRYFQGDWRIPLEERQKIGGTDAWVLERHAP
ncbi:hypothetical protein IE81DRAFT_256425 [Ceraceosorus guamensis]|uniref:N-acetyltransferase domain-containing protein n=1 Tax=Ceraceosorus guamensis TaxID=1522189 RepID=A0A316VQI7_9BASI|nr:hypothetical protein IE81DRAFT_256425 [Ceraceosorus guamensis]PWN39856.1 hypothetical protein IE81DRAFT_256425 [Ceraceosorus guamensis]